MTGDGVLPRARTAVACVALVALAVSQQPGRIVPDTKLDLAIDPAGFLARALHLWEPLGAAGQVQNQAYGYLFPMGPFFLLGHLTGLPAWLVQRAWTATLLCVALLGVIALARALDLGTPTSRLVGGLLYALSPRMITELGALSVEVLPMAVAPWVLVPLVRGAREGSPRRAAALSALAVLCAGGVNAAAAAVVLVPAALFLLTREPGARRRALAGWWVLGVALVTTWWAGPLLLLGRSSPPFLDYIESASTTTAASGLLPALRGTTQWIAYLADARGPQWPAGWSLVHDVGPVTATVVLAAVGVAALATRPLPERRWLLLCALVGLAALCVAYTGPVAGLLAGPARAALDGPLAPLRNLHKVDPVLRLPLVLATVHLLGAIRPIRVEAARALSAVVALALVATASPALLGRLAPGGFTEIPGYWRQTADFLAASAPAGRALLVPGSSFGDYVWGSPRDEPMQPLARSPWDARVAVPLTPEGHIRLLDAVEDRLARGLGGPELAGTLARGGVSDVVVRNDLDPAAGATRPILVARALADSPGLRPVASFGPPLFTTATLPGLVADGGLTTPLPAVAVYRVDDPAPRAWTAPLTGAVALDGGPDALPLLEARGPPFDRPALLGDDASGDALPRIQSDAPVRRERTFGRATDAASAGLAADDPLRLHAASPDYRVADPEHAVGVVRYTGARPSASDSASDPDSEGGTRPDASPWAALDDAPATAWRPAASLEPRAHWWRADLDAPLTAGAITVTTAGTDPENPPGDVEVGTDAGTLRVPLAARDAAQRLPLPTGPTRSVVLRFDPAHPTPAITRVDLPGVTPQRTVVLPPPRGPVSAYTFDTAGPARPGCVADPSGTPHCSADLVRGGEEGGVLDRTFDVAAPAAFDVTATAVPRPGPTLDALLDRSAAIGASASSSAVPDPRAGPAAAVDGDPATAWTADPADPDPRLELRWSGARDVDRLQVTPTPGLAARPTAVRVEADGQERLVGLDPTGTARFAPLHTDHLSVRVPLADPVSSFDPTTRSLRPLGIGIAEMSIPGVAPTVPAPDTPVTLPCGTGPEITVDGARTPTSLTTTVAALRRGEAAPLTPCGGARTATLAPGPHRLVITGTDTTVPSAATLTDPAAALPPTSPPTPPAASPTAPPRTPAGTPVWDAEHRAVDVGPRSAPTLLVVPENTNPGWVARLGDTPLAPRTVDGWQQGYVVPPGPAATVTLDFTPGGAYRGALAAGALAVVLAIALAAWPAGRSPPPVRDRRRVGFGVPLAAVGAVVLAAGPVGIGLLGVLLGAAALARRRLRAWWLPVLAAGGVIAAGLTLPAGAPLDPLRQALAALAVAALAASLLRRDGPEGAP